ncbi:hypothetical protein [Zavarzinella formosa]|uniref:hypothetical protein n=1 Tax=Zavarzinella formosa TaxID=360055 RepID=UPI0002E4E06C|nr:hypothetical protein [Zavarzinella formosa]
MDALGLGLLLLSLVVLAVVVVATISRFLFAISRTVELISPEYRQQFFPGFVWCLLIPVVGALMAVWMVWALTSSLRRQFEALGEGQAAGSFGLISGMGWACGQLTLTLVLCLDAFFNLSSLDDPVPQTITLTIFAIFTVAAIDWFIYWGIIVELKTLLESHSASGRISGLSQEEQDYGDGTGEREPENDSPAGTDN